MGPVYPELAGRVALVTGGSRGIGAATARLLAKSGVRVAVNGRDETAIAAVVRQIEAEGGVACGVSPTARTRRPWSAFSAASRRPSGRWRSSPPSRAVAGGPGR